MPSRNDLEGYCGETASAIIQLAGFILDRDAAQAQTETTGHAGVAQAVTGLLRLMPIHRRRGQLYVPADMLQAVGVTREVFLAGEDKAATGRVISIMLAFAREHLAIFEKSKSQLPKSLAPAFCLWRLSRPICEQSSALAPRLWRRWRTFRLFGNNG